MKRDSFIADRELIQSLEERSKPIPCSEGRILFKQGDAPAGVYILQSGAAVLMMESASGKAVMFLEAGPGSLLGLPGIVANEPYTLTAMARRDSTIRFVTRDDFEDVIRTEPALQLPVLQLLAAEVRTARRALSET
jgi:CRP/FNR family transcriptional regulator